MQSYDSKQQHNQIFLFPFQNWVTVLYIISVLRILISTKPKAGEICRNKLPEESSVTSKFSTLKTLDHLPKEHVPGMQNAYAHLNSW